MILFQAYDEWQLDLTGYGLTFNEQSDIFFGETTKSFSFPILVDLDNETISKLELVNRENITGYKIRIDGYLTIENEFYDAYLMIKEVYDLKAELQVFYGSEVLSVFDKQLSDLPFPIVDTNGQFTVHADGIIKKQFPDASHTFPMYYRPQIASKGKYELFEGYVNNFENGNLVTNYDQEREEGRFVVNRTVYSPAPYILEILRVGFASEGKEIRGEFVNDELFRKAVIVPPNIFENFSNTADRSFWRFAFFDDQVTVNNKTVNTYERTLNITKDGFYRLEMKLNFPKGIAEYFELTVEHGNEEAFEIAVENQALSVAKTLFFIVPEGETYDNIVVTLKISEQLNSIETLNNFIFTKDGGDVNTFPDEYSLSEFMPDMKFRDFFNALKEWLALDVQYFENAVYLNYLNNSIRRMIFDDHSDVEDPKKRRTLSKNNLFKLQYSETDSVLVSKEGQIFTDAEFNKSEITTVDFKFLPIPMGQPTPNTITGVYPEDTNDKIVVGMVDGLTDKKPLFKKAIGAKSININSIYRNYHRYFLSFRANAEQYKDSFEAHVSKKFNLRNGIFKYNKKHLIKSLRKRRISEDYWRVDQESESF